MKVITLFVYSLLVALSFAAACTDSEAIAAVCTADASDKSSCESAGCLWCGSPVKVTEICKYTSGKCECTALTSEQQAEIEGADAGTCYSKEGPTCTFTYPTPSSKEDGDACFKTVPTLNYKKGSCPTSAAASIASSVVAIVAVVAVAFMA